VARKLQAGRRLVVVGATALSMFAIAAPAQAGIGAAGPVSERTGFFPEWYEDGAGLRLGLCLDGPACLATIERPNPAASVAFPGNFPVEAFWWAAETSAPTPAGDVSLVLAHEAAFVNAAVAAGAQSVFGRIRLRGDGLTDGQWYRFTTPYGQFDLQAAGGGRQINFTSDIGCSVEGLAPLCSDAGFGAVGDSLVGPNFLTWDDTAPAPPAGYIADGVSAHTVTGSVFVPAAESIDPPPAEGAEPLPLNDVPANYFRIDRISGDGGSVVEHVSQVNTFVVQGKLADETPQPYFRNTFGEAGGQAVGAGPKPFAVKIHNGGTGDLRLAGVTLREPSPDFAITSTDCENATILPAGDTATPTGPDQTCVVHLAFDPSATGVKTGTLQVAEDGAGAPVHTIALSGSGQTAMLSTDQTGIGFGSQLVGTTAPARTLTVRNTGFIPLRVDGFSLAGAGDFTSPANTCTGVTLGLNGTCAITLHFTPQADGVRNATVEIASAAGVRSVPLSGVGTATAPAGGGDAGAPTGAAAGGATAAASLPAPAKLTLRNLATSATVKRSRATKAGIRLVMRLGAGTEVVRIRVYRKTKSGKRLLSDGYKRPAATGLYRVTQSHAALRRSLRALGSYEVEVTPGRSRTDLGTPARVRFRIIR
jgi:hypothetical protein